MRSARDVILVPIMILCSSWQFSPGVAQGRASDALAPGARDYLVRVLDIIQENSVKRDLNWSEFRRVTIAQAATATNPADTYPAIRSALNRLGDNHSSLMTPDALKNQDFTTTGGAFGLGIRVKDLVIIAIFPDSSADRAAIEVRDSILAIDGKPVTTNGSYQKAVEKAMIRGAKGVELVLKRERSEPRTVRLEFCEPGYNLPLRGRLVTEDIGYIELPQFLTSFTDQEAARRDSDQYAERVQALIRELDQDGLSAWIVDLRLNNGGNMWPMLAGIGPILGEGGFGSMIIASGSFELEYRKGGAGARQGAVFQANVQVPTEYRPESGPLPVAILMDEDTASAAEGIAIAFKGRPRTHFFGLPTTGLTTVNRPFHLSDGAILNLAISVTADRTGQHYADKILPDIEVESNWELYGTDDDPVIEAAVEWLKSQL